MSVSAQTVGDVPQCSACGRYIYGPGHDCETGLYKITWLTGTIEFKEPTYRVTRRWIGRWPFRELEYTAECVETGASMTMSREAFEWFAQMYPGRVTVEPSSV